MMNGTNASEIPQLISQLMTPMFMVTGAASMNWGLQRLQVVLTNRIHQVAKRSRFDLRPKVHDAIFEGFTAE